MTHLTIQRVITLLSALQNSAANEWDHPHRPLNQKISGVDCWRLRMQQWLFVIPPFITSSKWSQTQISSHRWKSPPHWNFVFKNIKCLWLLSKIFFNYTTSSSFDVIVIFRRFVISWSKAAPRPAADLTGPKCHMALERTLSLRKYMEFFSFDCFHARLVICLFVVADCCLCRRQPTKFYVVYTIIEFDRKLWMGRVSERSFFACFFFLCFV